MSSDRIQDARRHFFARGEVPGGLVPPPILRSWTRCSSLGLRAQANALPEPLTSGEFATAAEASEAFIRLCRPEIETLHSDAQTTNSIVILTNAAGLVLDTVGSIDFAERAARVALRPGVPWNERTVGTNAIGTSLAEGCPVEVRGAEHFLECNRILSCSAAPIIGPRGDVLGVLDLSGPAEIHHAHALGLVRLAAEQIEHRLFDRGFEHADLVRLHGEPGLLGSPKEGILVFENGCLTGANRHGLALLGQGFHAIGSVTWADLFADDLARLSDTGCVRSIDGTPFAGRLSRPRQTWVSGGLPFQPAKPGLIHPVFDAGTLQALDHAVRLIDADVPLLTCGETGTGKEVFARAAHRQSARAGKPFVAVNCAALPENLMEAELFGYQPGAFTGARHGGSKGHVREAHGGVLFLDEIGEMPLAAQAKLLRVLQEREVVPLGGGRAVPVDVALVCATNSDLPERVRNGTFRSDLYYRIAQYTIHLRPLRERDDLAELVDTLWAAFGGPSAGTTLAPECRKHLATYSWPGNFRQLVGCLRAMLALSRPGQTLSLQVLPADVRNTPAVRPREAPGSGDDGRTTLSALKDTAMQEALSAASGNVSLAARTLGISRSTLYRRMRGGQPA